MATLNDGTETIEQNTAPDEVYAKIKTALEKQADRNFDHQDCEFRGLVQAGAIRGKAIRKFYRRFTDVEIVADVAPSVDLTCQIRLAGSVQAQVFTLAAGQDHVVVAVTGTVDAAANTVVDAVLLTGGGAEDVRITLHSRRYIA